MPPTQREAPVRYMQGIAVPAASVRPQEFFARTRRRTMPEVSRAFAGLGGQDVVALRKADILAGIRIRFTGTLTVNLAAGTAATKAGWPYNLLKSVRFTANGQSNLINCSGLHLKARSFMGKDEATDRGVIQSVLDANVQQGTLSKSSEKWGVGSADTALAGAPTNYDVELEWFVPVAEDQVDLAGAIFAATSSTDLTLECNWATSADLFTLTGAATATLVGNLHVSSLKYSIPLGADGEIVVPDLSLFHSIIQTRSTDIALGEFETRLIGQGAGKTMLRAWQVIWNGTGGVNPAPIVLSEDNYGRMGWRYASNEQPDDYLDGRQLRMVNEDQHGVDFGAVWGIAVHEFASENAFRDTVDQGAHSELRLVTTLQNSVVLTSPYMEYVVETIFAAGAGA